MTEELAEKTERLRVCHHPCKRIAKIVLILIALGCAARLLPAVVLGGFVGVQICIVGMGMLIQPPPQSGWGRIYSVYLNCGLECIGDGQGQGTNRKLRRSVAIDHFLVTQAERLMLLYLLSLRQLGAYALAMMFIALLVHWVHWGYWGRANTKGKLMGIEWTKGHHRLWICGGMIVAIASYTDVFTPWLNPHYPALVWMLPLLALAQWPQLLGQAPFPNRSPPLTGLQGEVFLLSTVLMMTLGFLWWGNLGLFLGVGAKNCCGYVVLSVQSRQGCVRDFCATVLLLSGLAMMLLLRVQLGLGLPQALIFLFLAH